MKPELQGASRVKRMAGALLAAGALVLMGIASPAVAAEPGPDIPEHFRTGTITIHKLVSPEAPESPWPNNGAYIDPPPSLTGLQGVTFSVTPLTGVDLTTNAGWTQVQAWAAAPASIPTANKGTPFDLVTGPGGSIQSGSLAIGAYLIQETNSGDYDIVFAPDPFVVTIPLPTTVGDDATWITDVHVYPKNSVTEVTKTVDDTTAFAAGDEVTWTIEVAVPGTYGTGETMTSFAVGDVLHTDLRFLPGSVSATLSDASDSVTLPLTTDGADPTLEVDIDPASAVTTSGGTVTFNVVGDALSSLGSFAGGQLTVTFSTMVLGAPGEIKNVATASFNDFDVDSNEVVTTWVAVKVLKFEKDSDPKTGLAGAEFQVFTQETGGSPLSLFAGQVEGVDEFTDTFVTGADGTLVIPGLKLGGTYWLEETRAPERFTMLEHRIPITGLEATHTISNPLLIEIPNTRIPDWQLPLTGGAGTLVPMIGLGMMLLATGSALVATTRRRRTR